jgi:hypothetical protein
MINYLFHPDAGVEMAFNNCVTLPSSEQENVPDQYRTARNDQQITYDKEQYYFSKSGIHFYMCRCSE